MDRTKTALTALIAAAVMLASPLADACGDKLLSIARGIRLKQTYTAEHPSTILLYVGDVQAAKSSKSERKRLVQLSILYMSLRQAGHQLEVVETVDDLSAALGKSQFDFVMADVQEIDSLAVPVAGSSEAVLLPVLFKPSKDAYRAAEARYQLALKTPTKSIDHLEAIDAVMASRRVATAGF